MEGKKAETEGVHMLLRSLVVDGMSKMDQKLGEG